MPKIFIKVFCSVLVVYLHLEHAQSIHPGYEAGQGGFACTTDSNHQQVTLGLAEDTINTQHMVQYFVEQHEWHIQLLFIEHLQ